MSTFPNIDDGFGHWLAGFIDGEGCFFAGTNNNGSPSLSMTIALRIDDAAILHECQERTGLGKVYERRFPSLKHPQAKWVVFSKADCQQLTALLRRYPLRAKKARDFAIWAEIVDEHAKFLTGRGARVKNDWSHFNDLMVQLREVRAY